MRIIPPCGIPTTKSGTSQWAGSFDAVDAARRQRPRADAAIARRLALIAAVLFAWVLSGCGGPREAPLPEGATVLVIGDSITAGYGVDAAAAWPAQLAQRTGWRVIAAGVNGDRTAGGRERLPALLDEYAPALVIIELGGNDMLRGVATTEIVANLEAMIDAAVRAAPGSC